jgi:hypothetical protein
VSGREGGDAEPELAEVYSFEYFEESEGAYGGAGWYFWETEYPEHGIAGPFDSLDQARARARTSTGEF